jgi:hypothetical protein
LCPLFQRYNIKNGYDLKDTHHLRVDPSKGENSKKLTTPAKIPAAPTPQIALPIMKAIELGAAPQRAEAVSNIRMLVSRVFFTEKKVYILPNNSWDAQHVNKYTLPYQPTSVRELKSSVMRGMAWPVQVSVWLSQRMVNKDRSNASSVQGGAVVPLR